MNYSLYFAFLSLVGVGNLNHNLDETTMHTTITSTKTLGEIIRRQRKRQGLRQADLAAMVGASHVFLGDVEKGKPTVQWGRVLQLLDELGLRLSVDVPDEGLSAPVPATKR